MEKPLFGEGNKEMITKLRQKTDVGAGMLYEQTEEQAQEEYEANKAKEAEVEELSDELQSLQF